MALKTSLNKEKSKYRHDSNEPSSTSKIKNKTIKKDRSIKKTTQIKSIPSIETKTCVDHFIPAPVVAMTSFYPQYQPFSCCPVAINEWSPIIPSSLYTVPVIVNSTAMLSTPICPYIPPVVIPPALISPIIVSNDMSPVSSYYESVSTEVGSPMGSFYDDIGTKHLEEIDPIEYYLSLPKDWFPSARMMTMDPNEMIEEFCRLPDILNHASWILDLEFGIPKSNPITRPIPIYNVKFNSIHCKNTPDAIHPGFESCSQDFKRVLLFYYDCIVSTWYRGYVYLNCDRSVENFQSWLQSPMQMLGMCWP